MFSTLRRTAAVCLVAGATAVASTNSAGATAPPRNDVAAAIEAPAAYQAQFLCRKDVQPGVKAFRDLVLKTYEGTASVSEKRSCSGEATSEHKDGRAWDWGVDVRKSTQKVKGKALLGWLLATDSYGNEFATARRLGLMYVIWDKKIWQSYSGAWKTYSCSGVTDCHKDHMHFSFGWAGAYKKTSYWTDKVAAAMPPPIPLFDSSASSYTVKVPATEEKVWGSKALRAGLVYTYRASGVWHYGTKSHQLADAACLQGSDEKWRPSRVFRASGVWRWTPTTDTGGGCNTKDHTYVATVLPALTDAISFGTTGKLTDNKGSVTVRIRRAL